MIALSRSLLVPFVPCLVAAVTVMLGRAHSSAAPQDSAPGRAVTADEIRELEEKLASHSEFRAEYELKSKAWTMRLIVGYREPGDAFLLSYSTETKGDKSTQMEAWLNDGRLVSRFNRNGESKYLSSPMREPMELVEHLRVTLARKVNGVHDEQELAATPRFRLFFSRKADEPELLGAKFQVFYICAKRRVCVEWFDSWKSWDGARRVGDQIEVEQDDCHYKFSAETGLLLEARIGDQETVTLKEFHTEVEAKEFEPASIDPDSEAVSVQAESEAWRAQCELGRRHAFSSLAKLGTTEKLDDARFGAWENVMTDFYGEWLPRYFAPVMSTNLKEVDNFLAWYAQAKEAAGADAGALELLAKQTQEWRDTYEKNWRDGIEAHAAAIEVPPDLDIVSSVSSRGLEAEREIYRSQVTKLLFEPLLQRLTEGTAIGEHK